MIGLVFVMWVTACVQAVGAAEGAAEDQALFSFESGTHGFAATGGATLSASNEQAFAGAQSLKLSADTSGAASNIYAKLNNPLGLTIGGTYKFRIWVPSDANIAAVQPYVMDGSWTWTGNNVEYDQLEKNSWNTVSLTIPANAANPINEIGVQLSTSDAFNGSIYMDSIEQDEVPVVEPEPPSAASLSDLQVDGKTVPGFAWDGLSYIVHVPSSATSVTVVAETSDSEATAHVTGGDTLAVGENEINVVVTAADETEQAYTVKVIRALPAGSGKHITIEGTKFHAGEREIWINGANTPWDNWNDFGGDFDFDWWDNHFRELRDAGVNATRIWISSNGEVGIDIATDGHVSGATELHWNDLDSLFYIAQSRGIYIMATLLSFDHTKNHHSNYESWRNMLGSDEHIDSYVSHYVVPFVNRYKANPYLWSIDLMNEPDWVVEEQGFAWDRLQTLFAKMNVAIHENSDIPTTVGVAMVKYNSDTCTEGCQGNKVGDEALMAKADGNPLAKVDFWSGHYYDWMGQYWGVPMYMTPEQYGMSADRPNVIGETPAKGTTGHTLTEDYMGAYENGWQGIMPWTSNGVDSNGNMSNLAPATSAFHALHPYLVFPWSNAALGDLQMDGTTIAGFSPDEHAYRVNVPNSTASVDVTGETADAAATVAITGGNNLKVGENVIAVTVTAGDGISVQTYTITVIKAAAASQETGAVVTPPPSSRATLQPGQAGSLNLANKASIAIPAGASEESLHISIEELLNASNLIGEGYKLISPVFELLKNQSDNFLKPVKLTFAFDAGVIGANEMPSVFYYDEDQKEWVEIGGTAEGNRITAETDHFTKFAVFAVAKSESGQPDEPEWQLSDIDGHWAEAGIQAALQAGIATGYPDGTFRPEGQATRAQFAVMLMNALGAQGDGADLAFGDNALIGSWAKQAVAQAVEAGIINGYQDGSFRPNASITRAEAIAMIARALDLHMESGAATSFADDGDIPLWAKGSAAAAAEHGIVQGRGGNRLAPNAIASRAEAITIILKMLEN
jgi:hypothetical protein